MVRDGRERGGGVTDRRKHEATIGRRQETGGLQQRVSYLWFMPTGQYEMRQASDGVRCIRNGGGRVLAHGRLSLTSNAR